MPLAGGIIFQFEVSKFARTVGTLLTNGVSLLKAISIAIDTVDNRVVKEALQVLPPAVKAGKRMSLALEETDMFTPMVIQMTRVGEESGSLDQMMLELAKVFDNQVQSGVKRGLALLEPVLILTMGFIIAVIIMMYASSPISSFVNDRPTLKILALSFLLLIGFSLVVEGIHIEIPKGYIYFAMGFSVFVELLNQRMNAKTKPIKLRQPYVDEETADLSSSTS